VKSDAIRSFGFIAFMFIVMFFQLWKKLSPVIVFGIVGVMIVADVAVVDRRYFTKESFVRKYDVGFQANESDLEIQKDKSSYRVYNLQDIQNPFGEARTSYFHNSLSGYHGAKMRRYQDLYDSCLFNETIEVYNLLRSGQQDFSNVGVLNMLNTKYFLFGPERTNLIANPYANGNAWFVSAVEKVANANEELNRTGNIDTRTTAVTSDARFTGQINTDSAATIQLNSFTLNKLQYESNSASGGLAVFSEIYYPEGWTATIDDKEATILRANYILRALEVPPGKHTITFAFAPKAYTVGNKVTMASSWIVLLVLLGAVGLSFKD
jgi:hypothetical protein